MTWLAISPWPSLWVDPEGGPAAWAEPGFALLLPAGEAEAAAVRAGAMRLARRHGQAAVYVIQGVVVAGGGGGGGGVGGGGGGGVGGGGPVRWRQAVVPCFPGLEGLASDGVELAERRSPRSMPPTPRSLSWRS